MWARSCCQLGCIHVAVPPSCTAGHRGPRSAGKCFLGVQNRADWSWRQLRLQLSTTNTVTTLNIPEEDQGVLQSSLLAQLLNVLLWREVGATSTRTVVKQQCLVLLPGEHPRSLLWLPLPCSPKCVQPCSLCSWSTCRQFVGFPRSRTASLISVGTVIMPLPLLP